MTLRHTDPEPQLPEETKASLIERLNTLIQEISTADLPDKTRTLILHHASLIMFALLNMEFLGAQGVYDAVARFTMSAYQMDGSKADLAAKTPQPSLRSKIAKFCGNVVKALKAAQDVEEGSANLSRLTNDAANYFLGSGRT